MTRGAYGTDRSFLVFLLLTGFLFSLCGILDRSRVLFFLLGDRYGGFLRTVSVQPTDGRGRIFLTDEDVLVFLPTMVL
jgi:hypothetical protein